MGDDELEDGSREAERAAREYAGMEYRKSYLDVPSYHNGHSYWYLTDTPDEKGFRPMLEPVTVLAAEALYSTRKHPVGEIPPDVAAWVEEQTRRANG